MRKGIAERFVDKCVPTMIIITVSLNTWPHPSHSSHLCHFFALNEIYFSVSVDISVEIFRSNKTADEPTCSHSNLTNVVDTDIALQLTPLDRQMERMQVKWHRICENSGRCKLFRCYAVLECIRWMLEFLFSTRVLLFSLWNQHTPKLRIRMYILVSNLEYFSHVYFNVNACRFNMSMGGVQFWHWQNMMALPQYIPTPTFTNITSFYLIYHIEWPRNIIASITEHDQQQQN